MAPLDPLGAAEETLERRHFGTRALPASPKSMNIGLRNEELGQLSCVPGPALKGRLGTTVEFFCTL
jgi:hypothetical protein